MSPITKIALRRIRQNLLKSVFQMIAVGFSMLIISFFAFFELQTLLTQNPDYEQLPFTEFMSRVQQYMNLTIAFLLIITFLTVRIYGRLRYEENSSALAVLTSVGATVSQKRRLIFVELFLLYLPSTLLGVICGSFPGIWMGNYFRGVSGDSEVNGFMYPLLAIILIAAGILLILISVLLPEISLRRRSVIQSVRKQNPTASTERKGYRRSQISQMRSFLKRLANKSAEYHSKTYNRIALSFSLSILYPILAILLFVYIGRAEVVVDTNPFDGVDTAAAVFDAVNHLFLFLGVCFLVLTTVGLFQAAIMVRMQVTERRKATRVYSAIGMEEADIRKMIGFELKSVCLSAVVYFFFGAFIINACLGMIAGV